ncbi:aminotransferase class IV [Streptomyces sp. NPDC023838]|uniref:aminotransferase class IV n=1 Tax=Streptomyces sp. NPDC023838 TaxID=3154325 RepID=UPI00324A9FB2
MNDQSIISEGGTWNVGFYDGDRVVWPAADCLVGVTMELLKQAHEHDEKPLALADVAGMRAAFATNAAIGVRAIAAIDDADYSDTHEIVDTLRKEYVEIPADVL